MKTYPSNVADRFLLRFDRPGHRDFLKAWAEKEKRSLNSQMLLIIEAGEKALLNAEKGNAPTAATVEASSLQSPV